MSKIITLIASGYVNAVAGDIGKEVQDDTVEIGVLLGYNNTSREWWIETTTIVASGSAMTITAGTGEGTSVVVYYTTLAKVKERVLIPVATSTYDTELANAIIEAERIIDERLRPFKSVEGTDETKEPFVFATLPLDVDIVPEVLKEICADLAAGLFKRRHKPESFDAGWFNQAFTKLKDFIKNNWQSGIFHFSTTEAEAE